MDQSNIITISVGLAIPTMNWKDYEIIHTTHHFNPY